MPKRTQLFKGHINLLSLYFIDIIFRLYFESKTKIKL